MSLISITVDNPLAEYRAGSKVVGAVHITSKGNLSHNGIVVRAVGTISLQLPYKNAFNGMGSRVKPITVMDLDVETLPPGKLPAGPTRVDFEFHITPTPGGAVGLVESYTGAFIHVEYMLHAEVKLGAFSKALKTAMELIVLVPGQGVQSVQALQGPSAFSFKLDRHSFDESGGLPAALDPDLDIVGSIVATVCDIAKMFEGTITVNRCLEPIASVELHLIRVEGVNVDGSTAFETSYVQTTQVAVGDVCREMPLLIWIRLPRVFSCPNLVTDVFLVGWQVEVVIIFANGGCIKKGLPINLYRTAQS